jgi:hypothetical protein
MRRLILKHALAALILAWLPYSIYAVEVFDCDDSCSFPNIDIGIEFLYWKPCLDDLDYARFGPTILDPPATEPNISYFKYLHLRGEPGVRARIGKSDLWCGWNLMFEYTYIASSACDSVLAIPPGNVVPTLLHGVHVDNLTQIAADCNLHYQTFDFMFSHRFDCGLCGILVPAFGVELITLNQELNSEGSSYISPFIATETEWNSDYFGVGLKLGAEWRYELSCGISLFTKGYGMILSGTDKQKYTSERFDIQEETIVATGNLTLKGNDRVILPGYHIGAGLLIEQDLGDMKVALRAGYEFLQWHNVGNQRRFPEGGDHEALSFSSNSSVLGLHGVFAGVDMQF